MARVQSPPILSQIRVARSYGEQSDALQALKNEIIGHVQKKEKWVEAGVLEPVVKILASSRTPAKLNGKESRSHVSPTRPLSEDETARLHALQLLASFANGGAAFLTPMLAAGSLSAVQANISPIDNPPQVVVTALRALINIAEATGSSDLDTASLAETVFAPQLLDAYQAILTAEVSSQTIRSQITLVADLISRLCREERHQVALANAGIVDALGTRLASFVVARGQVVPGAEVQAEKDGIAELIPEPALRSADLTLILQALSAIIGDSPWRTSMLVYSPPLLAIFPNLEFAPPAKEARACLHAYEMAGLSHPQSEDLSAMDYLLPVVPVYQTKGMASQLSPFPPLGTSASRDNLLSFRTTITKSTGSLPSWDSTRFEPLATSGDLDIEDPESPLIPWLINLVRSSDALERVTAASVLASLFKAGFANRSRETDMGLLVVPLLIQTLNTVDISPLANDTAFVDSQTATNWAIVERTLEVLAKLVADSEFLQKCAFDCQAVKVVTKLLKDAYEPLPSHKASRPWSPTPQDGTQLEREIGLPTCRLGSHGELPLHSHRIRVRENALKAVGALSAFKDEYRKAFVEQEVVPFMVESLFHFPSKPRNNKDRAKSPKVMSPKGQDDGADADVNAPYGVNPISVIIAACNALRMLARSVSILRTSLEDHGVFIPMFRLLRHPEIDVQIAATGAICNLVTEVSPMRDRLNEVGIMKVLCEHAHSLNAALRLNALWALKHFIDGVAADLKKECLEELESGWLVQLICDDTEDEALYARTKSERPGSQVSPNDLDEDMEMDQSEEDNKPWQLSGAARSSNERTRTVRLRQAERKISVLREAELNPVRKARNDDLAIQEQGLNFIRNLIGPVRPGTTSDSSRDNTEMIDYLFSQLGQDRLFGILESKLQVKFLHPFSRRFSANKDSRVLYPQAKIIEAVVFILVHMAASVPRHRQIVISQTKLLQDLGKHFTSKDKDVRVALCHLIANLTWQDDSTDEDASRQRAVELKRLGLLNKLESLEQEDSELDVRERAKAAIWQINKQRGY